MRSRGRPPTGKILTPRESEVLDLIRLGLSNRQIAERLCISLAGVKFHVTEIISRLGVSTREEAARWRAPYLPFVLLPLGELRHRLESSAIITRLAAGLIFVLTTGIALAVGIVALSPRESSMGAALSPSTLSPTASPSPSEGANRVSGGPLRSVGGTLVFLDVYDPGGPVERAVRIGPDASVVRPEATVVVRDHDVSRLRLGDFVHVRVDSTGIATEIDANSGWFRPGSIFPVKVVEGLLVEGVRLEGGQRYILVRVNLDIDLRGPQEWDDKLTRVWLDPAVSGQVLGGSVETMQPGWVALIYPYVADNGDMIATGIANLTPPR